MQKRSFCRCLGTIIPAFFLFVLGVLPARASFHLMQIQQVIGGVNGDTTAQAIQLRMRSADQDLVSLARLKAYDATGSNPIILKDFTSDVSGSGSTILIASANFANYTSTTLTPDFTMTNLIPASYLAAGRITFEQDNGVILWSISFGGSGYTGSTTGSTTNDADGNFGPSFSGPLPSTNTGALLFQGSATALSTNNAADYALTTGAATFTNNAGQSATVVASATPSLAINNARTFPEGTAAAPGSTTFTITLSAASTKTVTVNYQTADNLAKAGSDYVAKTGTLTFAPGDTKKFVAINFIGDSVAENNEPFFLDIKTPTNATIVDSRGSAYIRNDDGPSLAIADAITLDEGNSGTKPQTFTVTLSAASANTVTVDYATANGTAGPADYTVTSGTLTFAPGETSKTITVLIKGDTTVETTETYKVNLSTPTFAVLADSQGIGRIRNDDASGLTAEDEPSQ